MINRALFDTVNQAILEALANTHTTVIAKVTKVGSTTISVQPVINRRVNGQSVRLPEFAEVPPIFMQGGSSYTAHPIAVGDYCLLLINERCFDRWYNGQDYAPPLEYRMHDYSDAFAIVGVNPAQAAISIPQVITHIGDTYQQGDYTHDGDRLQTGDYTINGDVVINGSLTINAQAGSTVTINDVTLTVTNGDVIADGISLKNHTHPGDSGGNTGAPN